MTIQSCSAASAVSVAVILSSRRQATASEPAKTADTVTISQAARDALATSGNGDGTEVDAKLAEIKARGAVNRSAEDTEYLFAHDAKLAAISGKLSKNPGSLTSSEVDYMQKATGFVNTMAMLSPKEKQMYDDMVAAGNSAAAEGMLKIGLIRIGSGHMAGGANGTTYDPINTEITAENVAKYFMHSIVDSSGITGSQFQALIQYLQGQASHPASSSTAVPA